MGHRQQQLRALVGTLKDKASLLRASAARLSSTRTDAAAKIAVLRATTHDSAAPPPEKRLFAVLWLGESHRLAARACIDALMTRLHRTRSAAVALKCLIVLYCIAAARGDGPSSVLRGQLTVFPSRSCRNFLNLSSFRDSGGAGPDGLQLSAWVRWFAAVLEQSLTASMVLATTAKDRYEKKKESNSQLLREIESLGNFVEQVSCAPESRDLQRNNLVYEAVRLAGEDYRFAQREIGARAYELGGRVEEFDSGESAKLVRVLQGLEDCRGRLQLLFSNRGRNDPFWQSVSETRARVSARQSEREENRLVAVRRDMDTRYGSGVVGRPEQLFRLPAAVGGGGSGPWLDAGRLPYP